MAGNAAYTFGIGIGLTLAAWGIRRLGIMTFDSDFLVIRQKPIRGGTRQQGQSRQQQCLLVPTRRHET